MSVLSAVLFGKWTDHVKGWRRSDLGDRIMFITYEEMVEVKLPRNLPQFFFLLKKEKHFILRPESLLTHVAQFQETDRIFHLLFSCPNIVFHACFFFTSGLQLTAGHVTRAQTALGIPFFV